MASCKSCYCNRFMLKENGCLYLFEEAYNRVHDGCPCMECLVKIMCRDRYNTCDTFYNFLNQSLYKTKEKK
jgi:hypothetical protein